MLYQLADLNSNDYIQCLKKGPLVYVRTLKAASTFFFNNFIQDSWKDIHYNDINWSKDHVFSYILDPVIRRNKALAEAVISGRCQMLSFIPEFLELISGAAFLDTHGISLHTQYKNRVRNIDWIPLSKWPNDGIRYTEKLLKWYDVGIPVWQKEYIHESSLSNKSIYDKIAAVTKDVFGETLSHKEELQDYLRNDILLYLEVVSKFNPHCKTWPEMSWLSK